MNTNTQLKRHSRRQTSFILSASDHGTLIINRNDYRITPERGDGVGYQILQSGSFDPQEVSLVLTLLQSRKINFGEGVVALDCGANIGVHTVEWAKQMVGWGSVVAIEPQERIFYALAGNIVINNCANATARWCALGAENGELKIPTPDYTKPGSFGSLELKKGENNEWIGQDVDYAPERLCRVELRTIDSFDFQRVDLIKIDVEGMEMDVLRGAEETLHSHHPQIIIERIKSNQDEMKLFLELFGYKVIPLGINFLAIHDSDPVPIKIDS